MEKNKKRLSIITIMYMILAILIFTYTIINIWNAITRGENQNSINQSVSNSTNFSKTTLKDETLTLNSFNNDLSDNDFDLNYAIDDSNNYKLNSLIPETDNNEFNIITVDFWSEASTWYSGVISGENTEAGNSAVADMSEIISFLVDMLNVVGTTVIAFVTMALGAKYIFGSADSKSSVKESLLNLLVACVFFFGWSSIRTLLIDNNQLRLFSGASTFSSMVGSIFVVFSYIVNAISILGVIYIGIRYVLSGAAGRAELKQKSPMFILGIVMAFCASTFLTFISTVINEML